MYILTNDYCVIAEIGRGKMTVGKIYVCLLILESWRTTRFGQIESAGQVSFSLITVEKYQKKMENPRLIFFYSNEGISVLHALLLDSFHKLINDYLMYIKRRDESRENASTRIEFEWMFVIGFFVVGFHVDGVKDHVSNREFPMIPCSFLITHESLVSR